MNKKRILVGIGAAAIVIVAICLVKCSSPKALGPSYQFEAAERSDIQRTVTATGTIEPIMKVEVGTQVSGTIAKLYVDYNSRVKKGQLLAEIDRTVLESELNSQKANLSSNKTEYDYQKKNYERILGLYNKNLVSQKDFETAEYTYFKAKSAYDKAQSDMGKARTNLNYASIYSPIDGVVLSRAVDEGQTVAASFNTPTLFTIANDLQKMQVIANVDEADIGEVANGQRVTFTVDAYPDDTFEGTITQVRLEPTTTSNVVTYKVVVNAPNPDLKLKPGLTANITIITAESKNALLVPSKALKFKPDNAPKGDIGTDKNQHKVWVKSGNGVKPASVQVGLSDGVHTEIRSGLKDNAMVAVSKASGSSGPQASSGSSEGSSPFLPKRPGK